MKKTLALILLCSSWIFAQTGSVKGKILDQDSGDPLIGANIVIDGTTMGAATDVEGGYLINNVPVGDHAVSYTHLTLPTIYSV